MRRRWWWRARCSPRSRPAARRTAGARARAFATPQSRRSRTGAGREGRRRRRSDGDLRARRASPRRHQRPGHGAPQPAGVHRGGRRTLAARRRRTGPRRRSWSASSSGRFPIPLVKDARRVALRHGGGEGRDPGAAHRAQRAGGDQGLPRPTSPRSASTRSTGTTASRRASMRAPFRSEPAPPERLVLAGSRTVSGGARSATCSRPRRSTRAQRRGAERGAAAVPRLLLPHPDRAGRRGARRGAGLRGQWRAHRRVRARRLAGAATTSPAS